MRVFCTVSIAWRTFEQEEHVAYRRVVEASSAIVARERGAVDDFVLTVSAREARSTVALVASKSNVTTDGSVETRVVSCTVVQIYIIIDMFVYSVNIISK